MLIPADSKKYLQKQLGETYDLLRPLQLPENYQDEETLPWRFAEDLPQDAGIGTLPSGRPFIAVRFKENGSFALSTHLPSEYNFLRSPRLPS